MIEVEGSDGCAMPFSLPDPELPYDQHTPEPPRAWKVGRFVGACLAYSLVAALIVAAWIPVVWLYRWLLG